MSGSRLAACAALAAVLCMGAMSGPASAAAANDVPRYRVDPSWPKDLPNNWIVGQIGGVSIDSQDHIWVLQRPRSLSAFELGAEQKPPRSICCVSAPAVVQFDKAGNVLKSWGGPGHVPNWPRQEHAIFVDRGNNVWISGNAATDRHIIKFSADGRQLLQIGSPGEGPKNNQDTTRLFQPADIYVDDAANEVYIADGYGNNRVVVYDSNTGAFKRGWGAYGIPLEQISNERAPAYVANQTPSKQFGNPVHCVRVARDGMVYVCDRTGNRIQVFTKAGQYVKELFLRPETLGSGSAFSVAFSHDRDQKYLLVADGESNVISILRRDDGTEVGRIGRSGRNAGHFHMIHQVAMDSNGDIYTGEVDNGMRLQKFTLVK